VKVLCVLGILFLFPTASAQAQIYVTREADGTLVFFGNKPNEQPAFPTSRSASTVVDHRFDDLVIEYAAKNSLRPELVRAVIEVESGFNPNARSPKGAMGLMQLMPQTAAELGVLNPYDPVENIRGGATYLRQLLDRYNGDEVLALAAYNAGPGSVDRFGRRVPPFQETQNFVRLVGRVAAREDGPGRITIYRINEIIDGKVIPRFTPVRPSGP
jgi:soluble lytic murein transglycosylase-like protein